MLTRTSQFRMYYAGTFAKWVYSATPNTAITPWSESLDKVINLLLERKRVSQQVETGFRSNGISLCCNNSKIWTKLTSEKQNIEISVITL